MAYKWETLKAMPSKRVFASPLIHEDNFYVVGGCDERGIPVDCFEMYNTKQKKWHRLQNIPTKRAAPSVAAIGNKIVAVAGVAESQTPLNAVEIYDISEKKWTSMDPLGQRLLGVSNVVRDGKIYLMGGMMEDTNPSDIFVELDLERNTWQKLPSMITARYATFSFLVDDKIYVLGGRQGKLPTAAFEMFDFSTKQWIKLPDIPSKRVFALYTTDGKRFYSVGGLNQPASSGFSDVCEIFDIDKGEWRSGAAMPTKRGDFAVGVMGGKVVCAGGLGNDGKPLATLEVYDVDSDSWSSVADCPSTHCSCTFTMFSDRMFVTGGLSLRGPSNSFEALTFK